MGTAIHSAVSRQMRDLDVSDLLVNRRLYGTSQFISPATGLPYSYRIPDYRIGLAILDIKPFGTPLSGPQVTDFMNFGMTRATFVLFNSCVPW